MWLLPSNHYWDSGGRKPLRWLTRQDHRGRGECCRERDLAQRGGSGPSFSEGQGGGGDRLRHRRLTPHPPWNRRSRLPLSSLHGQHRRRLWGIIILHDKMMTWFFPRLPLFIILVIASSSSYRSIITAAKDDEEYHHPSHDDDAALASPPPPLQSSLQPWNATLQSPPRWPSSIRGRWCRIGCKHPIKRRRQPQPRQFIAMLGWDVWDDDNTYAPTYFLTYFLTIKESAEDTSYKDNTVEDDSYRDDVAEDNTAYNDIAVVVTNISPPPVLFPTADNNPIPSWLQQLPSNQQQRPSPGTMTTMVLPIVASSVSICGHNIMHAQSNYCRSSRKRFFRDMLFAAGEGATPLVHPGQCPLPCLPPPSIPATPSPTVAHPSNAASGPPKKKPTPIISYSSSRRASSPSRIGPPCEPSSWSFWTATPCASPRSSWDPTALTNIE